MFNTTSVPSLTPETKKALDNSKFDMVSFVEGLSEANSTVDLSNALMPNGSWTPCPDPKSGKKEFPPYVGLPDNCDKLKVYEIHKILLRKAVVKLYFRHQRTSVPGIFVRN